MLNKNDPLIGAVQEVMKRNQAERDATKLVNEKFGITDRKALPREKQGDWDAAYKSVLNESDDMGPVKKKENVKLYKHKTSGKEISAVKHPGKDWELSEDNMTLHPNQQKLDLNKNKKLDSQDFKMLRAKKSMEEENAPKTDPYAEQQAGSVSTVSKPKPTSVTPADQSALTKKIQSVVKEAKAANPYAIGMAAVEKSTGDKPPIEKKNIKKAHEIAKKIIAKKLEEGFNDRHSLSVTASAEKQTVAEATMGGSAPAIAQRTIGRSQRFRPRGSPTSSIKVDAKGPISQRPGINAATGSLQPTDTQRRAGYNITNVRDAAYGANPTDKKLGPASSTGGSGVPPVPSSSQARPYATGPKRVVSTGNPNMAGSPINKPSISPNAVTAGPGQSGSVSVTPSKVPAPLPRSPMSGQGTASPLPRSPMSGQGTAQAPAKAPTPAPAATTPAPKPKPKPETAAPRAAAPAPATPKRTGPLTRYQRDAAIVGPKGQRG